MNFMDLGRKFFDCCPTESLRCLNLAYPPNSCLPISTSASLWIERLEQGKYARAQSPIKNTDEDIAVLLAQSAIPGFGASIVVTVCPKMASWDARMPSIGSKGTVSIPGEEITCSATGQNFLALQAN